MSDTPRPRIKARLDFDTVMMANAIVMSMRATCQDRAVGCVLTKGVRVVATGYNGAPSMLAHCQDRGCLEDADGRCIRCVHAELNACLQLRGEVPDTAFCTLMPCVTCLKALIQAGVSRIMYYEHRNDKDVIAFMHENLDALHGLLARPNIDMLSMLDRAVAAVKGSESAFR